MRKNSNECKEKPNVGMLGAGQELQGCTGTAFCYVLAMRSGFSPLFFFILHILVIVLHTEIQ